MFTVDSLNNLIATGGEDDKAFVYSITTDKTEMLFESEKFQDSVTNVKFSHDGKYLAASDMGGKIRVYLVENFELFWSYDVEADLDSLQWHPSTNVLFCGTADGNFNMFKISTNEVKIMYNGDNSALSCFKILKEGTQAVCCYNNGNIRIWDLKSGKTLFNLLNAHEKAVKNDDMEEEEEGGSDILCIDMSSDGKLIATGGLDMKINIITPANGKIVWKFTVESAKKTNENSESDDNNNDIEQNSIESVGFCKTMPIIACCTLNGQIITWDLNTHAMRNKLDYSSGFSKVLWDETTKLFASSLDGAIYQWDGRNLEQAKKNEGHISEILDFCLNKKYICSASNDQTVKIFEIQ